MHRVFLVFGALVLSAFGQVRDPNQLPRSFPPDIVPQEVLEGRDVLRVDPAHYRLDFENEHVRAVRLTLKPDETVPMHDSHDALAVCVKECHLRFTRPDGRVQDIHMETGETRWIYGDTHSAKNLNTQPMEMLFIGTKAASKDR
jgi:quercetin dioxygenase-like cupin family protein